MSTESVVRVRPWLPGDEDAICRIAARNGLSALDPSTIRNSRSLHPFAHEFRDIPAGWVLEIDGAIVGNLSNIHMLYELGGRRLLATVASAWAVDSEHRGKALRLMSTFFRQKGVDLLLNVSASPATAKILTGMKIPRLPIPDYGRPCFWATRPRAFARAALTRRGISGAAALAWPAGFALLARDVIRQSGRGRLSSAVRRIDAFDDRFDDLWNDIAAGPVRLRAVRTRAVLEWRYRAELRERRASILIAERAGRLSGYAVLTSRPDSDAAAEGGMSLCDVADLQAAGDDPATFRDLLLACICSAREDGRDAVKFMTGTPAKRLPAERLHPISYQMPFWQQYFQAGSPELAAALAGADAWDFSLFDTF